jgi:hypothetical protein
MISRERSTANTKQNSSAIAFSTEGEPHVLLEWNDDVDVAVRDTTVKGAVVVPRRVRRPVSVRVGTT